VLAVELLPDGAGGVLWADGRRTLPLDRRARVEVCRSTNPVRLARLSDKPFTDRLVEKFALPVGGWRGHPD
jgi:NAD+ kinase